MLPVTQGVEGAKEDIATVLLKDTCGPIKRWTSGEWILRVRVRELFCPPYVGMWGKEL